MTVGAALKSATADAPPPCGGLIGAVTSVEEQISTRVAGPTYGAPMTEPVLEAFVGSLTAEEFCARTGQSVEGLVEFCFGDQRAPVSKTAKAPRKTQRAAVETRTRGGREAFDAMLLELLRGARSGMGARDIAEETEASLPQIRSSIARLVEKKAVRFEGKTAARRYWARG